ncbi:uncharacterized protein pasi2 [Lepeophtheirus salmonis]|uniref:uncharacterized protein pasi2 n=1 Tax=Lepeophtheirus salmonis TaxID=72036 RepID=UPI003AF36B04
MIISYIIDSNSYLSTTNLEIIFCIYYLHIRLFNNNISSTPFIKIIMSTLGRKTGSISGSHFSVASHTSTLRSTRHGGSRSARASHYEALPWYKKPLLKNALYTNLQRGAWHVGFYSLILSVWTIFTSSFDVYCLEEAKPGTSHTGYYIISFEFVYVGNPHVRNLLITVSIFSLFGGIALCVTSILLLNGLRREYEVSFKPYLYIMGSFTLWKIFAWLFCTVVNDMIFAYHIVMFFAWLTFNVLNIISWMIIYSLYLELSDITKLQDLAKLKMDTMSSLPASRAQSLLSRPISPYNSNQPTPLDMRTQQYNSRSPSHRTDTLTSTSKPTDIY